MLWELRSVGLSMANITKQLVDMKKRYSGKSPSCDQLIARMEREALVLSAMHESCRHEWCQNWEKG